MFSAILSYAPNQFPGPGGLGYLGRTGLLEAYFQRVQEEEKRETGVVAEAVRPLGRGVRRMLAPFRKAAS